MKMKNRCRLPAFVLAIGLTLALLSGCKSRENRYTYRDAGIEALNAGDLEGAIAAFDQAIEASSAVVGAFDIDVLKYRAEAEYRLGDYTAAAHTYDVLIEVDEERVEYINLRCASKAGSGDLDGALKDYNRSQELDPEGTAPGYASALLAAGKAMESNGDAVSAMVLYEQARDRGVVSAELFHRMGLCKMGEADYKAAIDYFDQGLAAPDAANVPELFYNQAVAYEHSGDFKKALGLMEQYVSAHGADEEAEREITFLKTR